LEFYRKYVAKAPTGRQRPQAEDQIALLTPIVAAAERSRVAPPEGAGPDQAEQSSARRTSPIVAPVSGAAETQLHPAVVSGANDASARQPKSKRWVWGVVAGGAVVVALAVGLGVGLAPHSVSYASTTTTAGTVQW